MALDGDRAAKFAVVGGEVVLELRFPGSQSGRIVKIKTVRN